MKLKFVFQKNFLKQTFTDYYHNNTFNGRESVSGGGSDLIQTDVIRVEIPKLLKKLDVKEFIDAPCGDFYWMQHVILNGINYTGIDIVGDIIRENKKKYKSDQRKFICKNIIADKLPKAELILIRDCWVHLSYEDIFSCIDNLKKNKIQYLLTTSFINLSLNKELEGIWRPLNLEIEPFNFPQPIQIINENCTEDSGNYSDKSLLLWEISKLTSY